MRFRVSPFEHLSKSESTGSLWKNRNNLIHNIYSYCVWFSLLMLSEGSVWKTPGISIICIYIYLSNSHIFYHLRWHSVPCHLPLIYVLHFPSFYQHAWHINLQLRAVCLNSSFCNGHLNPKRSRGRTDITTQKLL